MIERICFSRLRVCWKAVSHSVVLLPLFFSLNKMHGASLTVRADSGTAFGNSIQNALDQLPGGGEVTLGPGTYVIRTPIVLAHDGLKLIGSGAKTILFLDANANCPVVILGAPDRGSSPIKGLGLTDVFIDGNRQHQRIEGWRRATDGSFINNNGVDIRNVADSLVERVTCCRCRSGGLVTSGGTRRLTVKDFTAFDNQFDGLACYLTEDSRFIGLSLHDNLAAGISLDLDFNNNIIERVALSRNDLGIFMRDACCNAFKDLAITGSRNHGVFMAQALEEEKPGWLRRAGTECTGNRFTDLRISNSGGSAFWVNDVSCTNNSIMGGSFLDNHRGGLAPMHAKLVKAEGLAGN
jgi:polygalacturonase